MKNANRLYGVAIFVLAITAAVVTSATLAGCGASAGADVASSSGILPTGGSKSGPEHITGIVQLDAPSVWIDTSVPNQLTPYSAGDGCGPSDQLQLVAADQKGTVLGQTMLTVGTVHVDNTDPSYPSYTCEVPYSLSVSSAAQYGFTIGNTPAFYVSRGDLAAQGWTYNFVYPNTRNTSS